MKVELHRDKIGVMDDPEVDANLVSMAWLQTDKGTWCQQHVDNLTWVTKHNTETFGFDVIIIGDIEPGPALTEFLLLWT